MRACRLRYTISISHKSCEDIGGVVTFGQDDAAQRNPLPRAIGAQTRLALVRQLRERLQDAVGNGVCVGVHCGARADVGVLAELTGNGRTMAFTDLTSHTHGSSRACNSIAEPCHTPNLAVLIRDNCPPHHAGLW
jgi:hypothetical protein